MYQFQRILKMDLRNLFTNPMWWVGTLGLPFLMALIMGFITKGSYGSAVTSYDYYSVTILIFGALNNATVAANSFMETRIMKANMRLCSAPVPAFFIHFSKVIASFLFGAFCHTIVFLALHVFLGANFGGSYSIFFWLLMLAVEFFAVTLGVAFCCILKSEEAVNQLLSNLVSLFCLLGGAFLPMKGFGRIIGMITNASPVTWINTAAFQAIYDGSLLLLGCVCMVLLALSVLCVMISIKFFHTEDYL